MALYNDEDVANQPPVIREPVMVAKPSFQSTVIDTRYEPAQNLLTWIDGSPMTVDYYSQVIAVDNEIGPMQASMPGVFQQYRLIKNFELRVVDFFSSTQNDEDKSMELRGTSNVYPCLTPNEGDMFTADIGDGRAAIFQVLSSERKSVYKEAVYAISYVSVKQLTPENQAQLDKQTVEKLNFVRDFLTYGRNPFITDEADKAIGDLTKFYNLSVIMYMEDFVYGETKSLLVPDTKTKLYDHFVSSYMAQMVTTSETYLCQDVKVLNCSGSKRMKTPTLFDAIAMCSKEYLSRCVGRVAISSPSTFNRIPQLNGIYFCAVDGVVVPVTIGNRTIDPDNGEGRPGNIPFTRDDDFYTGVLDELDTVQTPFIKPVWEDDYYILSEAFYKNDRRAMSILERLVMDYIEEKEPQFIQLSLLVVDSYKWGRLESFYYLPLLYTIIKSTVSGF